MRMPTFYLKLDKELALVLPSRNLFEAGAATAEEKEARMDAKWMFTTTADSVRAMLIRVGESLLRIGGALLILVVGWLIAKGVRAVVVKALKALPVDEFSRKFKVADFLQKGEVKYQLSELVGVSVYWVILLAFLLAVLDLLGLAAAAGLLERILSYVPQVVAGVLVLVLGLFFAAVVSGVVQTAAANAGVSQARGLGQLARATVIIFAVVVALEKFLSSVVIQTAFNTVIMGVALAFGLAFGLGCKDIAGRAVSEFIQKTSGWR